MDILSQTYLTHREVIEILRVSPHVLRQRMRQTPDTIERPWIQVGGSAARPRYRWPTDRVFAWWTEVNQYRTQQQELEQ